MRGIPGPVVDALLEPVVAARRERMPHIDFRNQRCQASRQHEDVFDCRAGALGHERQHRMARLAQQGLPTTATRMELGYERGGEISTPHAKPIAHVTRAGLTGKAVCISARRTHAQRGEVAIMVG